MKEEPGAPRWMELQRPRPNGRRGAVRARGPGLKVCRVRAGMRMRGLPGQAWRPRCATEEARGLG